MTTIDSNGPVDLEGPVSPFRKHEGDSLLKFIIGDFLPSHDLWPSM